MTSTATEGEKIEVLCMRAHKWGVSCPSEDLQAVLAVSLLAGGMGEASPQAGRVRGLMKAIQKELKRLDKLRRHPLHHMPRFPSDPMELPRNLVEMACGTDRPVWRADVETITNKVLNGPKFKRHTASSYKDSSTDSSGSSCAKLPGAGAIAPIAPGCPATGTGHQQQQQQQQLQQYAGQFMMMMLQNQMSASSAAKGGINLTFAPEVGGALPSRPDVGVKTRAPGADRGHQPSDKVAEPSAAAEDMPDIEGDPLAQLNANMKENDLARKDMQPEKRKKTNKASEIRKAAKKSAGPTGDATDGEADTDEESDARGGPMRRPAARMPKPAAAKPAAARAACEKPHPKKGSKRYKLMNAFASKAYSAKMKTTHGDKVKARKAYGDAIKQWKCENP